MELLILGLVMFFAAHGVRIFAEDWRARQIARLGPNAWKGLYSVVSLAGFALIVWGYGLTRAHPIDIWDPPLWTRHLAALLTVPTFILWVAVYVPGTRIKAAFGHPMIAGVKAWAFAHLIANGRLGDIVLFAAFLLWSVFDFRAARRRDRVAGTRYPVGPISRDVAAVAVGLVAWWVFAHYLHVWLIGVRPLG